MCNNENHKSSGGKPKSVHLADVVFYYNDPYLKKRIYLHTDLISYAKDSISTVKLRDAFKSLCMTIECAKDSDDWRAKYSIESGESYEVRGFLFVHNHDNEYANGFSERIDKINLNSLPMAPNTYLHFLRPADIQRLYSVGNDIIRLKKSGDLSAEYTFYYPDLVMWHRQGDIWGHAATIE